MKRIISLLTILTLVLTMNIVGWSESQQPSQQPDPEVTVYTEDEFETLMKNEKTIDNESEISNGDIEPMTKFFYRFDRYTAEHNATSDFQYYMGEFTVYNQGSSPVTASYTQ